MDTLSEVLRAVRLTGAVYFDVRAGEPWVAETPSMSRICRDVMPEFEHVIAFHLMLEGWCWAQLGDESEPPVKMQAGDAVLFPHGTSHYLGTEAGRRAKPDYSIYYRPDDRPLPFLLDQLGGQGDNARFVCGYLGCDARPFNPVINSLPRMILLKSRKGEHNRTMELIRMGVDESAGRREGAETVLAKLSELMFVEAVRSYVDSLPSNATGWLAGLRDPHIGAALNLMHGRPADNWTLEQLAEAANLSRSAFAERFTEYVSESPMRYLARWRMQLATRFLESPGVSIARAAERVGYHSEAAFNRAFKKHMGMPPGAWRRCH